MALLLVSGGFVTYELITRRQTMMHDLSTLAEVIGNESAPSVALGNGDTDRGQEVLGALKGKPHIVAAALYKDGHLFAQYPTNQTAGFFPSGLSRMVSPDSRTITWFSFTKLSSRAIRPACSI